MNEELRALRAQMNLSGLTRKEAADALYLSVSALNRKLRGAAAFSPQEQTRLLLAVLRRKEQALDRAGDA